MSSFLGTYGAMQKLKCPSSESTSYAQRSSYKTTLGGRVVEQRGPRPRREWSLNIAVARPSDMAVLESLYLGDVAPLLWVSPDAYALNLFSPGASLLEPGLITAGAVRAGSALAADGVRVPMTALVQPGTTLTFGGSEPLPAVPGERMTASVYASGAGGTVRLVFRDAAGAWLGNATAATPATLSRVSVSRVVPAGTHDALLQVTAGATAVRVGAPSASYGTLMPWTVGRGCPRASINTVSSNLLLAVAADPGMNISEYSYTIKEVG